MMDMVEQYFLKRFPEPFRPVRVKVDNVSFSVEHRVEKVACRSGRFWPFWGKTWTEDVHEFRIADGHDISDLLNTPLIRVKDIKPGSELFFNLCHHKEALIREVEKELVLRYEAEKHKDKRIHSCIDSYREMCRDE